MAKDYPKNYKWMLLALLSAMYFLAQGSRQIFNAVLPQIKTDFAYVGITDAQLGFIGSAFTLVFGLAIPFGGVLADFFSRKWMIVVGSLLFSVGIFTSGFASGVGLLVLAYGVLNAAGQALLPPSNSSLIGQFHVETRATAFSIYQIVFYIGIVVCSCVSGWLSGLGAGGWRKAFFLFGAISAAWAFALAFLLRDTPQVRGTGNGESSSAKATEDKLGTEEKASVREALGAVVCKPSALLLMVGLGFYFYAKYGFNTWIIAYLQREFPSITAASASFHAVFWFYLGATVGVFIGGRVSDRFAALRPQARFDVNIVGLLLCVPGLILAAFAPSAALCVVGVALLGFATGVYDSNLYASLFEVVKPRYRAAAVGVFGCGGSVIGASGPAVLGWMNAHFSMSAGIASLSAFALAGAAAIGVARIFFFESDKVQNA
ncbi:MAG: MFS transporter [Kiritimatiellae bacterium]|nr:MFS transporter [Kiritimatiellia bacterium]